MILIHKILTYHTSLEFTRVKSDNFDRNTFSIRLITCIVFGKLDVEVRLYSELFLRKMLFLFSLENCSAFCLILCAAYEVLTLS